MKKLIPLILAMLVLCGCASLLETSVEKTVEHHSSNEEDNSDPVYIEVSGYDDLKQAMYTLIVDYAEEGIIRFTAYEGDVEQNLNSACSYITNDTAIGSYAVSYIGTSLNRYVSYYEAAISIIYKKDAAEMDNIVTVSSIAELEPVLTKMLEECSSSIAIKTTNDAVNADSINSVMSNLYYSDPQLIVSLPLLNIVQHSDANQISHIYEVNSEYINSKSIMTERRKFLRTFKTQLDPEFGSVENEAQLLYQLCMYLSERTDYTGTVSDEEYDRSAMVNTAYGALQQVKASSEGFAMAMKLLCDWYDIDCKVVTGRYDNYIHSWNIIKVDGEWYHFDITKLQKDASEALVRTDKQMARKYSWDTAAYPVCNGDLNYTYLTGSGQTEVPAIATDPESTPDVQE